MNTNTDHVKELIDYLHKLAAGPMVQEWQLHHTGFVALKIYEVADAMENLLTERNNLVAEINKPSNG